jgi:hypothetical protein
MTYYSLVINKQNNNTKGVEPMSVDEKKILETFAKVIPKLTERQKERLLWIGEGIALKTEQQENGKQTA